MKDDDIRKKVSRLFKMRYPTRQDMRELVWAQKELIESRDKEVSELTEKLKVAREALEEIKNNEMRGVLYKAIDIAIKALKAIGSE